MEPRLAVISTGNKFYLTFTRFKTSHHQLTSFTPALAATALVVGRVVPNDRFSTFSFVGDVAVFSIVDVERRVEVAGLVEVFAVNVDEVPLSFGFVIGALEG